MMNSISATHYDLMRLILVVSYWKAVLFQFVFTVGDCHSIIVTELGSERCTL